MLVIVNGKQKAVKKNCSLDRLLKNSGVKREGIIIDINGTIIGLADNPQIRDNDIIEILKIRGGG